MANGKKRETGAPEAGKVKGKGQISRGLGRSLSHARPGRNLA